MRQWTYLLSRRVRAMYPPDQRATFPDLSEHPRTDWNDLWLITQSAPPRRQNNPAGNWKSRLTSDGKASDGFTPGSTAPQFSPHNPGMCPSDPQTRPYLPNQSPRQPNRRIHRGRKAKEFTAINTVASRCSSSWLTRRPRATTRLLLAESLLQLGPAKTQYGGNRHPQNPAWKS